MQFPWKWHICQGGSIAKNVFLDSLSVFAKFQVGNKKCTIQPKFRAMPPDYMICTTCLLKGISGMQFSMQIWTHESQAACLAHKKHVQIVGNIKIYFTILIYFYHHIVALRCVAVRACAKHAAWDSRVQTCIENCIPEMPLSRQLVQIIGRNRFPSDSKVCAGF